MRLAGSPEVYTAISGRLDPAESQRLTGASAARATAEADAIDSRLEAFFRLYELLQSKGYSESAAQQVAVEMMEGRQPAARMTRRFAATHGHQYAATDGSGPADREL